MVIMLGNEAFGYVVESWAVGKIHDPPNFDRSDVCPRMLRGNRDGVVEIASIDQIISPEEFASLGEWAIGDEPLSLSYANTCGGGDRVQR